ncbi:hypothetical protein ACFFGT_32570 [Mucilaginibacter angelicae]|uniref:Uncharacterized protein n=1 Tax=Mucilaginibacter angelicae TaxID=869718 RepID=A0ABV6LHS3_9SPHI
METKKIKIEELYDPFRSYQYRSYSVEEILAAGGATAFAVKMGKSMKGLEEELQAFPDDAFLTDEEFEAALAMLRESK